MATLTQDLLRLRKLKREYDAAHKKADAAEAVFKAAQAKVYERMERDGVESMKASGTLFVRSTTTYASMQNREEFIAWAEENEPELFESKERKALLNALVRERLDNDQELPPGVCFYSRDTIAQRAA